MIGALAVQPVVLGTSDPALIRLRATGLHAHLPERRRLEGLPGGFRKGGGPALTHRALRRSSADDECLLPSGVDLGGFFLVRGDPERLGRLSMSPEFMRLMNRASTVVESLGVVAASPRLRQQVVDGVSGFEEA
jgi:hypothetical protein